jgi:hypothetical protein
MMLVFTSLFLFFGIFFYQAFKWNTKNAADRKPVEKTMEYHYFRQSNA